MLAIFAVGVILWRAWPTSLQSRLQQIQAALNVLDADRVEQLAGLLEQAGYADHARLYRSRLFLRQALHSLQASNFQSARRQASRFWMRSAELAACAVDPLPPFAVINACQPDLRRLDDPAADEQARARKGFARGRAEAGLVPEDSPLRNDASMVAGECLFHLGQLRGALEAWNSVVAKDPDFPGVRKQLATTCYLLGSMEMALQHAEAWAAQEPTTALPHRLIASIARTHRQFALARDAYVRALELEHDDAARAQVVQDAVEMLLDDAPDVSLAEKILRQCPPSFAEKSGLLALRASCHWLLGRRSEAQRLVEAALQQDPNEFHALALLAQMNLARDRPAEALPSLERVVELRPHDFRRRDQLAQTHRRLGDLDRAREQERLRDQIIATRTRLTELSKQALESPLDDTLRCELAGVYLELGRPREAEFWFKAALHGNPGNETARHALQQLNWLGDPESPNVMRHVPR